MRTAPIALLLCIVLTGACADRALDAPAGPSTAAGLAPPAGRTLAVTAGPNAIGPELAPQDCSLERSLRSLSYTTPTQIEFINLSTTTKVLYWLDYAGARVRYSTIPPHYTGLQPTYVTHPWVVADESGTCLGIYSASQVSTVTLRDTMAPLTPAMIASSLAAEINSSFIRAMTASMATAGPTLADATVTCSAGGTFRIQYYDPVLAGRVSLSNAPIAMLGCAHTLNGRTVVAHGVLRATGAWEASEPASPVWLTGEVGVDDVGPITIDGTTGVYFLGQVGRIGVGPPDTPPPPNPGPSPAGAKYDGVYDFLIRFPTGPGTSGSQTVARYLIVLNSVVSSSDGAMSGRVDGSGGITFRGPCLLNSYPATFSGNMNWQAAAGANSGEGTYACDMRIDGPNTWRITQSR